MLRSSIIGLHYYHESPAVDNIANLFLLKVKIWLDSILFAMCKFLQTLMPLSLDLVLPTTPVQFLDGHDIKFSLQDLEPQNNLSEGRV